jgi:hypothetical protein
MEPGAGSMEHGARKRNLSTRQPLLLPQPLPLPLLLPAYESGCRKIFPENKVANNDLSYKFVQQMSNDLEKVNNRIYKI